MKEPVSLFEKIMAEILPNPVKETDIQVQETRESQKRYRDMIKMTKVKE